MSSESGKPFAFGFASGFCLFFGGALVYLATITTDSMKSAVESGYGIFGIAIVIIGIGCGVMSLVSFVRTRKAAKKLGGAVSSQPPAAIQS